MLIREMSAFGLAICVLTGCTASPVVATDPPRIVAATFSNATGDGAFINVQYEGGEAPYTVLFELPEGFDPIEQVTVTNPQVEVVQRYTNYQVDPDGGGWYDAVVSVEDALGRRVERQFRGWISGGPDAEAPEF